MSNNGIERHLDASTDGRLGVIKTEQIVSYYRYFIVAVLKKKVNPSMLELRNSSK